MTRVRAAPEPTQRRGRMSPLSAEAIRQQQLRNSAFGRRGYRCHEVDLLLARIASEVEERDQLIVRLRTEIDDLRGHYRAYYSDLGPVGSAAMDEPAGDNDATAHGADPGHPWFSDATRGRGYVEPPRRRGHP